MAGSNLQALAKRPSLNSQPAPMSVDKTLAGRSANSLSKAVSSRKDIVITINVRPFIKWILISLTSLLLTAFIVIAGIAAYSYYNNDFQVSLVKGTVSYPGGGACGDINYPVYVSF